MGIGRWLAPASNVYLGMRLLRHPPLYLWHQPGEEGVRAARLHEHAPWTGKIHHQTLAAKEGGLESAHSTHSEADALREGHQVTCIHREFLTWAQSLLMYRTLAG
jgi:hypothetical protein